MRILFVSHAASNPNAGASRVYHLLTNGLRERGHTVNCLHLNDFAMPRGLEFPAKRLLLPQFASKTARKALAKPVDVLMASNGMLYPLFRELATKPNRPLLVNHLHGLSLFDHQATMNETLRGHMSISLIYRTATGPLPIFWDNQGERFADLTIVQNGRDADAVEKSNGKPVIKIPLSVHARIASAGQRAPSIAARDPFSLLWFASWIERKGRYYLPRALQKIAARFPQVHLTLGGTEISPAAVKAAFHPSLHDQITVLPHISVEEHIAQLERNSIFLFPSLSEGFGFALLEAMAMGMACVTTQTGLGGDWLRDRESAMLIPAASSTYLADAVIALLEDQALRSKIAENARVLSAQFTIERMLDQYESAFEQYRAKRENPARFA
jgi:glycosyltransferase involved in cell wall biosynthesis